MSLKCPKCSAKLGFQTVGATTDCPGCGARVTSRILRPAIAALTIWTLLEIVVSQLLGNVLDDAALKIVFKVVFGVLVGIPLVGYLIEKYGDVEIIEKDGDK
jgi:hypothetical protein